ncbi:MAG TPA: quinone-dependent dihydroorotate dehydrogenase [Cryptosporangiaceae bacterium]|nr:quinone-dependent dihydroorotate dehydrogenase [Cryptosporangiaceae bacterium]
MVYERLVRPALFRLGGGDAETAHEHALRWLARLGRSSALLAGARRLAGAAEATTVFGVRFPGPVGLAAGMDKDGVALRAWPALGFGFVEVGTVTWHPQPGNPRPRLFRLPASEAIVNRMGFNNAGACALAGRLAAYGPLGVPLGVSLGKSRATPLGDAVGDYVSSLRALHPYADYVAVNVSSPNTPGLRSLQDRHQLGGLLAALRAETATLGPGRVGGETPLLVKVAPDLTDQALGELLEVCDEHGVAGVIATNTTLDRSGVAAGDADRAAESGGLSGRPLADRAVEVVRFVTARTGGRLPVIGVGGILDPADALRMRDAGASLVQLYTGLVYRGPTLVRRINRAWSHLPVSTPA